jgi:uncharacterized protein
MDHASYPPELLRGLLTRARTIAMVGASPETWRPAFAIMRDLQRRGYRVIPVNPHHSGELLQGEPVVPTLAEAGAAVDLVNVFRRPDALAGVVDEAVALGNTPVWAQIGVASAEAAARADAAGLILVMNRCISVEHRRLVG